MTVAAQPPGCVKADETCGAGDQYSHALMSVNDSARGYAFFGLQRLIPIGNDGFVSSR
jgi:hypothetical protein